jgi:hypothetical protein
MTNLGPSICPKCGAAMNLSAAGGMKYSHCPACKYTVGSLDRRTGVDDDLRRAWDQSATDMYSMFWGADYSSGPTEHKPPAVDEPHANMPPVDGALFACILDDDMSPTTLDGMLNRCYTLRGYSKQVVASSQYYRTRNLGVLIADMRSLAWT